MHRPRIALTGGMHMECVGRHPRNPPYLWIGSEKAYVASAPRGNTKRQQEHLQSFLIRSLEAVSGKKVVLR